MDCHWRFAASREGFLVQFIVRVWLNTIHAVQRLFM